MPAGAGTAIVVLHQVDPVITMCWRSLCARRGSRQDAARGKTASDSSALGGIYETWFDCSPHACPAVAFAA